MDITTETRLVYECLSTSRVVHLILTLVRNGLVDHDSDETDEHNGTNNAGNGSGSVGVLIFIHVGIQMLVEDCFIFLVFFNLSESCEFLCLGCSGSILVGTFSSELGGGPFTIDGSLLSSNILSDLGGLSRAENLDTGRLDHLEVISSDSICLDDGVVDVSLSPL